jgi:asparagine synthase (glutamine-hydrolysing)
MISLLYGGRWETWLWECVHYTLTRRRLPPLGLRSWLRRRLGWTPPLPQLPAWLDDAFARRTNLPERWRAFHALKPLPTTLHAEAYNILDSPLWSSTFERQDPGFTACPLEIRSPFFDVRLVEFVLAIPVVPWCVDKELVRSMMRGVLPEAVRTRPKAPLAGDPVQCHLRAGTLRWTDHFDPVPELAAYVDAARMRRLLDEGSSPETWWKTLVFRPIALNYWLRRQASFPDRDIQEPTDEQQAQRNACQVALS